jgi:hypothetical protein
MTCSHVWARIYKWGYLLRCRCELCARQRGGRVVWHPRVQCLRCGSLPLAQTVRVRPLPTSIPGPGRATAG